MNKYGKIWCWPRNYEKFDPSFSPFCECLFIFGQIGNYLVYQYSNLTCSINDKQVFGPSWIFGKFKLTCELQIWRLNKIYRSYLVTTTSWCCFLSARSYIPNKNNFINCHEFSHKINTSIVRWLLLKVFKFVKMLGWYTWTQCYETFYVHNLRMFVIS